MGRNNHTDNIRSVLKMKEKNVNLDTIELYPAIKEQYEFLDKYLNNHSLNFLANDLKELKIVRRERKAYLVNLRAERDRALKFLKQRKAKEKEFPKIVRDLTRWHSNDSALSKYNLMFCEFYLNSSDNIRLKLFKYFPELVDKIIKINQSLSNEKTNHNR